MVQSASNRLFTPQKKEGACLHSFQTPRLFEKRLAGLPVVKHPAREVVLTAGSKRAGCFSSEVAPEVIKDGERIANVSAPGSVFGEQAVLLDQPHTADVRTLEQSEFMLPTRRRCLRAIQLLPSTSPRSLRGDSMPPTDHLSRLSIRSKTASLSVISKTVEKVEELLSYCGGASLIYAGYPYDPFQPDKSAR